MMFSFTDKKNKFVRGIKNLAVCAFALVAVVTASAANPVTASAAEQETKPAQSAEEKKTDIKAPVFKEVQNINTGYTHPFGSQTNKITLHWNSVKNAKKYNLYVKGGKYDEYTLYKTVKGTSCTVSGLKRATNYSFVVKSVAKDGTLSSASKPQTIKTARIDFDKAGWQAMCRIVYHEVGKINDSMWDKPIVYVADCVVNRYEKAKYTNHPTWSSFYKNYNSVQSMIYKSGGFMSSTQLTNEGAAYSKVSSRVKTAVYGAVYGISAYKGIKNDNNIYYWCNRSYKSSGKGIAYQFKIPWGYFNVWRTYWG